MRDPLFEAVRVGTIVFYSVAAAGVVIAVVTQGPSLERLQIVVGAGVAGYVASLVAYVLAYVVLRGRGNPTFAAAERDGTLVGVALVVGFAVAAAVGLTPTGREIAGPLAILFLAGVIIFWAAMAVVLVASALRHRRD